MIVHVDKTGRHDQAGSIDRPGALGLAEVADRGDLAASHADVGPAARRSRSIDDRALYNDKIVRFLCRQKQAHA